MIPSALNHVRRLMGMKLKTALNSPKFIDDVLSEFDDHSVASFKKAYVATETQDSKEIPILTTMTEDQLKYDPVIVISLGEGSELDSIMGLDAGGSLTGFSGSKTETVALKPHTKGLLVDTTYAVNPQGEYSLPEVSGFSVEVIDNQIVLTDRLTPFSEGDLVKASYDILPPEKSEGFVKSIICQENVVLTVMSKNQDTIAHLDAIIKALAISMRLDPWESKVYQLGRLDFQPLYNLYPDEKLPNTMFAREIRMSYRVTYSITRPLQETLEQVNIHSN